MARCSVRLSGSGKMGTFEFIQVMTGEDARRPTTTVDLVGLKTS